MSYEIHRYGRCIATVPDMKAAESFIKNHVAPLRSPESGKQPVSDDSLTIVPSRS